MFEDFSRLRIIRKAIEQVGCGHHLLDSVGGGNFGHLQRLFETTRAIVDAGEDMAMNVDHALSA